MLTDDDLSQISGDVCSAVLGLVLEPLGEVPDLEGTGPMMTATIQVTGELLWTVRLDCSRELARVDAALMFGQEPEEVSDDDVNDAFGELANMTGGNVKNMLAGSTRLALPTVTGGVEFRVVIPRTRVSNRAGFTCDGQPLVVTVLKQTDGRAAAPPADQNTEAVPLR
jgi:chemotaxis protein CheX